ncbi:TIGR00255 family protein [Acetitomaculum ruminis DSM 5522]|uniref:TIGR00255 family protein n=1 Tax=Acetitomaculum ruminis DSM 5522 TaxID=1120918 RepID=A0A1I0VTS0_9FIRM|nr:YicC/YloC family endoribonuclease [Acetitomaculum ruminis]SFA79310.1 TIGR00255 family protein [Acetitomaculum ruminis DSM 5522]
MIKSMTGFGRYEFSNDEQKITVEIKSVNHRYLDASIKMPKKFSMFESDIRNILKDYLVRGKVDLFVTYEDYTEKESVIVYNRKIAKAYVEYCDEMSKEFEIPNNLSAEILVRYPEVIETRDEKKDDEALGEIIFDTVRHACESLVETRKSEGSKLCEDIMKKLDGMITDVDYIEKRSPETVIAYRAKLKEKLDEVLSDTELDENRIAAEVVIYADKVCVDEETVRLRSHIEHMKQTLNLGGSVGRKLDFIAQEMNREANTILSKAGDIDISNHAINLKTEIEKVREQIQNIE